MQSIQVKSSTNSYPIYLGKSIRFQLTELLSKDYEQVFLVSDEQVASLYLEDVLQSLRAAEMEVVTAIIPSGEASKSIDEYYRLQTMALEHQLDRNVLMIALGGGVVGDLTGFVAATFMRGVDYIQMPTSILAHDSSVGGKVAINHELGKNLIGSFYPPVAVIYDVETLASLPKHEVRSGYAEIIKEAYIADRELLENLLTQKIEDISDEQLLQHLYAGITIKAEIVEKDEKETYLRKFLNFGHTLAHAIEAELHYGSITHGEAVAIGMYFALRVSEAHFRTCLQSDRYRAWLEMNRYPLNLFDLTAKQLIQKMKIDKKSVKGQIQMVLLEDLGKPTVVHLSDDSLETYLESFKKELSKI